MVTVITAILEVIAHIIMYAAKAIALASKVGAKTAQVAGKVTVETGKVAVKAGKAGAKVAKTGIKAGTKAAKTGAKAVKQGAKVAKKGAKVAKQGAKTVKKGADIARKGANVAKKGADTAIKAGRTVKDTAENSARLAMSATQEVKDFANATEEEKVKKALGLGVKAGMKALELAKKATFLAAKTLWTFLKIVTKVIALMYATAITGIAFTVLLFIGAVSIIVILMANSGVGMIPGVSFDGGNQGGNSGYVVPSNPSNPDNPDNPDTPNIPVNPSSGDCIACLQTMANWYLANVTTYQAGPRVNGNKTRKNYSCPLMSYKPSVGDDCSAFAAAYASLVSGVKVDDYGSGTWIKPNAPSLINAGWTPLYTNDIGGIAGLQPGDILVCNDGCTYAQSKGHHCEVYIASGQSFGWGKVQTKYPSNTTTLVNKLVKNKTTGTNDYIAISSGGHDYVLVWRYTGGN